MGGTTNVKAREGAAPPNRPIPSNRATTGQANPSRIGTGHEQLLNRLGTNVQERIMKLLSSGYNNGCSNKPNHEEGYQSISGDLPKNCFETVLWTLGIRGSAPREEEFEDENKILPRLEANGYHTRPNSIPLFTTRENNQGDKVVTGVRPIPAGLIPGDVLLFGSPPGMPTINKYYFTPDFPERGIHASPEEKARAGQVWEALKTAGYINIRGEIQSKFNGKPDDLNIGIEPPLTSEEKQKTMQILNNIVKSAREHTNTYFHGAIYLGERDGKHYIFQKPSWNCGPDSPYQITTIEAYNSSMVGQPINCDNSYSQIFVYRKQSNDANLILNPGSAFHFTSVIPSSIGVSRQF
ncbi:MAG: hypothetical protein WC632_01795 [Candidatus Margulisiibacteriota bacterium]